MPGPNKRHFPNSNAQHAEDLQPNEALNRLRQNQPPSLVSTQHHHHHKHKTWISHGRGNGPRRGSGNHRGSRGGFPSAQYHRPDRGYSAANWDRGEGSSRGTIWPAQSCGMQQPTGSTNYDHYSTDPRTTATSRFLHSETSEAMTRSGYTTATPPLTPRPALESESRLTPLLSSPVPPSPTSRAPSLEYPSAADEDPYPTPPSKRLKLTHEPEVRVKEEQQEPEDLLRYPSSSVGTEIVIKTEKRSPSPLPCRRLVTSSCNRYPLPENCQKINADYLKHRQALVTKERGVLRKFGLKATNVFFRDDGMVIEWTSSIPVWSDTYLPDPPESSSPTMAIDYIDLVSDEESESTHLPLSSEAGHSDAPPTRSAGALPHRLPLPRRNSWQKPRRSPCNDSSAFESVPASSPPAAVVPPSLQTSPPVPPPGPSWKPPLPRRLASTMKPPPPPPPQQAEGSGSQTHSIPHTPQEPPGLRSAKVWSAAELHEVEPLAIEFLRRFIHTFDASLSTLSEVYTSTALFSCRIFEPSSPTTRHASTPLSTATGHLKIGQTLALLACFKFCPTDGAHPRNLHYDVVSLRRDAGGGILLTVFGEVVNMLSGSDGSRRVYLVNQSFVLQKPEEGEEAGGGESRRNVAWPLVILSHQMVLRPNTLTET